MTPPAHLPFALAGGLAALGLAASVAIAQPAPAALPGPATQPAAAPPLAVAQGSRPSVSTQAPIRPAPVRTAPAARPESQPAWTELTPRQQQALAPLAASWRSLGEAHKRKWIALSQNYHAMPPGEQARLHSRMGEWAALSPQQRTLARMNFAETQKVDPEDKRAKWEAYQRLSPEEKRRLAAGAAAPKPPPTALAVKPVPDQKLADIPKPKKPNGNSRPVVAPRLDRNPPPPQPREPLAP